MKRKRWGKLARMLCNGHPDGLTKTRDIYINAAILSRLKTPVQTNKGLCTSPAGKQITSRSKAAGMGLHQDAAMPRSIPSPCLVAAGRLPDRALHVCVRFMHIMFEYCTLVNPLSVPYQGQSDYECALNARSADACRESRDAMCRCRRVSAYVK